jgi:hypothetical protein
MLLDGVEIRAIGDVNVKKLLKYTLHIPKEHPEIVVGRRTMDSGCLKVRHHVEYGCMI